MANLYETGTVIELEEDGKKKFLRYNGHNFFEHRFLNITPDSKEFGLPTLWSEDSEYGEWAARTAKVIGKLSSVETEVIYNNPKKAKKLLEVLLEK